MGFSAGLRRLHDAVNAYDRAARPVQYDMQFEDGELSFLQRYGLATAKWSTRLAVGAALDKYAPLPKANPFMQRMASGLKRVVPNWDNGRYGASPYSYRSLLGVGGGCYEKIGTLAGYKKLFCTPLGRQKWVELVKRNFAPVFEERSLPSLSLKSYLRNTLFESDLRRMLYSIEQGAYWKGLAGFAGLSLLGWGTVSKTRDAYRYHHAKEDGSAWSRVKTVAYTAAHFVGQVVKSVACWELGTIGYLLAGALLPVGGWLPIVGGILLGAGLSTVGYKLLSRVIPEPPKVLA